MQAALRAAFIETTQRQAGPQFHAQPAVDGAGLRFVHSPQQWQAHLDASGLALQASSREWRMTMALQPPVCGAGMERPQPQPARNEASYARGAVREWYLNGPLGLEQGFTVTENPCPGEPLRIDVALGGDLNAQTTAGGLVLRDASGKTALRYTDLYAKDATGRRMKSQLKLDETGHLISLFVNEEGGKYPITIDPLLWTETQRLSASDKQPNDWFGFKLASNGNTAVFTSLQRDGGAGAAWVYSYAGGIWTEMQRLRPADPQPNQQFGNDVAMNTDTIVVGSPQSNNTAGGAAYVFMYDGTSWVEKQKIVKSEPMQNDGFGAAVAMDQDQLIITSPYEQLPSEVEGQFIQYAGAAYVYRRDAGGAWNFESKIVSETPSQFSQFGFNVELNGDTIALGSYGLYTAEGQGPGEVSLYVRNGSAFALQQKITSPSGTSGDNFGLAISIDGDDLLIGAPLAGDRGSWLGVAHHFTRIGTTWVMQQQLTGPADGGQQFCGYSVLIRGELAIIGCPLTNIGDLYAAGVARVFQRAGVGSFSEVRVLTAATPELEGVVGTGLELTGQQLLISAWQSTPDGVQYAGSVHVFQAMQNDGAPCAVNGECSSGYCVDGVCCNEACGGNTQSDCQACAAASGASADGMCTVLPAAMNYTCRKVAGQCDVAEVCDGSSGACPVDAKVKAGTQCRGATGICDLADTCDGLNDGCFDQKKKGTVCRSSGGPCDIAEVCDGVMNTCPLEDKVQGTNFQCKAAGLSPICDPADYCDGRTKLCPMKFGAVNMSCGQGKTCSGSGVCR